MVASRSFVGGGGMKLSLKQCGFQESVVEEKLSLKGHPWCSLLLTMWATSAKGSDWWECKWALHLVPV